MTFWEAHEEREAVRAEIVRKQKRAAAEAEILDRIPDCVARVCCLFRHSEHVCEGECQVLAGVLG